MNAREEEEEEVKLSGKKKKPVFFSVRLTPLLLLFILLGTFGRIDRRALSHEISSACQIIISKGGRRKAGGGCNKPAHPPY
jgi:hypothetical protein